MCGLVGMVGFLERKHKEAMRDLLFLNTLRGKDSTGLSVVSRNRSILTRKMTVPGYEFIEYPIVDRAMSHGDQLWIGHNRFKTYGEISKANAHPFEVIDDEGDVLLVGAHNGTLTNKWDLEQALNEKFDTDSEALFNLLVDQPTFKAAVNMLKGAWSLVWWDPTKDSVHFCRNNERPLTYAFTKDRKVMIWASEPWMLINACRRNGVELEVNDKGLSCYATSPDSLYTMAIPQEANAVLPELVKEGGYSGAPSTGFHQHERYKSWWADGDDDYESKTAAKRAQETPSIRAPGATSNVIDIGFARGFKGEQITFGRLQEIKKKGCVWCKEPLGENKAHAFVSDDSIVCMPCIRDEHPKENSKPFDEEYLDDEPFDDEPFDVPPQEGTKEFRKLIGAALGSARNI